MRVIIAIAAVLVATRTVNAQDDVQARMRQWSEALGVQCVHCHVDGAWSDASKPVFPFALRMMRMVNGINAGPLKGIDPITCWTCHRGQMRPVSVPRASWDAIQKSHDRDFSSRPDRALAMSVYSASLGVECSHCHQAGDWTAATKPAHAMVTKMLPIFDEIQKHFDETRRPATQCYMCHQGQRIPERQPR